MKTWLNELPEKEGIYLWKNSLKYEILKVNYIPEYWEWGIRWGDCFMADGRHVSKYKGKFIEISDFIESIK